MKVKELIEVLENEDGDTEVLVRIKGYVDLFSPLIGALGGRIYTSDDSSNFMDVHTRAFETEEEWEDLKKVGTKCIVLYPSD